MVIEHFLTPRDMAEMLAVSYESALAFIRFSGIDYVKIGRQYRVSEQKLEAFLQQKGRIEVDLQADIR